MPLTHEKRLDSNFTNNNDHNYLHKKFKKMASTLSVFPGNTSKSGETRYKETNREHGPCNTAISNGSISAAHPEIEKIKDKQIPTVQDVENNVQTNFNENSRLSDVNNFVQVSGQTSFTDEFSNKTENLENEFIRETYNGGSGGRYICPYCKLSCAKPSVLQKHIRAHTNERPYPCVPCGFAFKTKSNLYKHQRSRAHALRLQGADVSVTLNDEDLSGGSESDTSIPPTSISDAGSEPAVRLENFRPNEFSSPELTNDSMILSMTMNSSSNDNSKSKTIYKPKFRAAFYQETDDKDKIKKTFSQNAEFLTEHISKIISDNEAIVDVIDTPLQKKYGKIKQIAESKQFLNENIEFKHDQSPLNLTKNNSESDNVFRKRSHSESFSQIDQKHPLNPEGSIIKDLLLKTKGNGLAPINGDLLDGLGALFVCPICQIFFRSADNLEVHRLYYCKGNISNQSVNVVQKEAKIRPENVFVRSNSINVRLPESPSNIYTRLNKSPPLRSKPDNLVITKSESNDVIAPLPSPGPLLGNTRLVDTRIPSDFNRKSECSKIKPIASPKRRLESRSDTYSPRSLENISPRSTDLYPQPKIRCIDPSSSTFRSLEEMSQQMRNNSTSLQMFGGEVKIVDHLGSTTTLRIEPSKNQLSPILIQQSLSPSKLGNDTEASSVVVRSGLHSGGTIMHNPPTPKEIIGTPQPKTPRISISSTSNIPNIHNITHFQFPPLSAITAFNPLTLPPLSPPSSPSGASTILHGGKLIPHVPGIPGPNTPGVFMGSPKLQTKNILSSDSNKNGQLPSENQGLISTLNIQTSNIATTYKYESIRRSRTMKLSVTDSEKHSQLQDAFNPEMPHYVSTVPIIKIKNVDEPNILPIVFSPNTSKALITKQGDAAVKRNSDGMPRAPTLKENINYMSNRTKIKDKIHGSSKNLDTKPENEIRNFNFENLITKTEIYNNQIPSSSEVQKNTNAQETPIVSVDNGRSETSYFQKSVPSKAGVEERKPKFLRPSTLPLKPGTFTPKRHHGITPNANTMPLVSPETPRPAKAYGQLYLNGNAYTYLGLKCSTKVFYCTINRPQPTYVPNQHFLSMYSNWQVSNSINI